MEIEKSFRRAFNSNATCKYRQDLVELKETAVRLIDEMMVLEPKSKADQIEVLNKAQFLIKEIEGLCREHVETPTKRDLKMDLRLEDLQVGVERMKDCSKENVIGGHNSVIGFKNMKSYLIATETKGIILIEDGTQFYQGQLLVEDGELLDISYTPPIKCYLIAHDDAIYRKDINNKPPFLYLDVSCGWRHGVCFRYSPLNQRIILIKDETNIALLNPKTKKIELELEKRVGNRIMDFRVFGEHEDRAVSITWDGHILLYSLGFGQRRGVIDYSLMELIEDRDERGVSIAVCHKNEYVLVEITGWTDLSIVSRMLIFQVKEDSLVNKACFEQYSTNLLYKYALECCGYAGSHVLWVGLSRDDNGVVQLYDYDIDAEELRELKEKRISHQEKCPLKLHRLDGKFYYTGWEGQLMSLRIGN